MASIGTVNNQYTKKYRNDSACLKRINFNNLVKNMRSPICLSYIKYQVFTSKEMRDHIGHSYILFG